MEFNYGAVRSASEFTDFVDKIIEAGRSFGFDVEAGYQGETTDPNVALKQYHPQWILVGFSFTNSAEWARYVPIAHDSGDNVDDIKETARQLWRLLHSGLGVAHNANYELNALGRWFREQLGDDPFLGAEVTKNKGFFPVLSDSMIESFLVQEYNPILVGQGLKGLVKHIFGHQMIEFNDLFEELIANKQIKKNQLRFNILELSPKVITYACEDSLWCLQLHRKHMPVIERLPMYKTVYKAEIALLRVCAEMEYEGLLLDWGAIAQKSQEVDNLRIQLNEEIQQDLSDRLGELVNINLASPAQVADMLFTRLDLPVKERSEKTGQPSTSEKALRSIAKEDPIIKKILEYREVVKLNGSYLKKYTTELSYDPTGRARPNHKQTGTSTGRFSVDGVSYQQWPKPYHFELNNGTIFDLNFRDFLLSPEGFRIIGFDFSQVELRVLAGAAQEHVMIEAFDNGTDIHVATASTMLGIPVDEVTSKDRQIGKTINFAVVYGSGADGLANLIGSTREDAQEKLSQYFKAFPGIKGWMDEQVTTGKTTKYVENLFGRRTRIWEFDSNVKWLVAKGERFCGNAPIQGGAGDYLKIGMVRAFSAIKKAEEQGTIPVDSIRMIITFHDALEFYVHESVTTEQFIELIEPAISFPLPGYPVIRADWHEGYQWGSLANIELEDGKISNYEVTVELPNKETFHWEDPELPNVLGDFYSWAKSYYDSGYHGWEYFASRHPEYSPREGAPVPAAPSDPMAPSVVITLSEMPDREAWNKFKEYVSEKPGDQEVKVVTPEGSITFDTTHKIVASDQAHISYLLGGARLDLVASDPLFDFDEVDL